MSSPPPEVPRRRSQRDKRPAKPVTTVTDVPTTSRKRKHVDETEDDAPGPDADEAPDADVEDADEEDGGDDPEDDDDDDDEVDERPKKRAKKMKGRASKKPRKTDKDKDKDPSASTTTRKPRKPRAPKDPNVPTPATKRAPKSHNGVEARFDPEAVAKSTDIAMDNPIFNGLLNPNAALQSTTEDFLESLSQTANEALAELITMILRCCGCNETIDGDEVIDFDGVVGRLDDLVEQLKQTTSPAGTYPLTSKAMPFYNAKLKYSFRSHLSEFFTRLVTSAALLGTLYTSELIVTLSTWLVPMSSSQIRSIRHTATVISLEIERALCEVGKDVEKEAEVTGRMREGEKKRARTKTAENGASSARGKEKELEVKMREIKSRQKKLEEFIREFDDGVFIHRYRDLDPVIRTECITALSTYFEIFPSHFCSNSTYLRYVGWVLSDPSAPVRLAAIKALQIVYESAGAEGNTASKRKKGGVVLPALTHFTTRFLSRLLQIARFDVDVGVRVAVMSVLGCVDELGLLSESDRNRLGTMIYAEEPRIRKGVARFVSGVWEEWIEAKMGEIEIQSSSAAPTSRGGRGGRGRGRGRGGASSSKGRNQPVHEVDSDKVGIKGLVYLLVRWARALDRDKNKTGDDKNAEQEEEEEEENPDDDAGTRNGTNADTEMTAESGVGGGGITAALVTPAGKKSADEAARGRTTLAVEAIWDEVDIVRNWEVILEMLVLDHSALKEGNLNLSPRKRGAKGKEARSNGRSKKGKDKATDERGEQSENEEEDEDEDHETQVDEAWRLNEVEEGVLLEVLVASLRMTKKEDETTTEAITRQLMKSLPRLFIKYQTDENRIANVLLLPTLMKLEAYLEMREQVAYKSLWSDIGKQFHTHTSPYVLTIAVHTITSHLLANTSLSNINSQQILELEDELATSLRDTVAGRGNTSTENIEDRDIEIAHLSEDETLTLTSIVLRLRILAGHRDLTSWMEESESGTQSSAWDILCAIAERGRLSLPGEGEMVEEALQLLTLHVIWKSHHLTTEAMPTPEEVKQRESLISQRDALLEKLIDYAVGTPVQGNGVVESVKRVAFKSLLDLHVLFSSAQTVAADGSLLPLASEAMALSMDDEVQWRCAGYVQAEVERHADAVESEEGEDAQTDQENTDTEGDQTEEEDEEDEGEQPKKSKKARGKKGNAVAEAPTSRIQLEQEYVFIDVISTFLRAIRAGAIHVRHGATLLAHSGRLGPAFDTCSKVVVDLLKEEGMLNDNAELVVLVVTQAMKESFGIVQASRRPDETITVLLAKLLSGCFIMRGSQLAVLHRLNAQYIVQVHTNLLTWIAKQIGAHHNSSKKKEMKTDITFFRALIPLVASVQSRDALKIKAHLDQTLAQANVEPAATKMWEPLRAYEKRLGTAMGKDKPPGAKGRPGRKKKNVNASARSTDAEESEGEVEKLVDDEHALSDAPPTESRPQRPRRAAASRKKPAVEDEDEDIRHDEPDGDDPATPKAPLKPRPKPRATYKSKTKSPQKQPTQASEDLSPQNSPSHGSPGMENGLVTPKKSLKRPRENYDEREPEPVEDASPAEPLQDLQATPAADMQIRRKRIRH